MRRFRRLRSSSHKSSGVSVPVLKKIVRRYEEKIKEVVDDLCTFDNIDKETVRYDYSPVGRNPPVLVRCYAGEDLLLLVSYSKSQKVFLMEFVSVSSLYRKERWNYKTIHILDYL